MTMLLCALSLLMWATVLQVTSRIGSSFMNSEKVVSPKPCGYSPPLGLEKMCVTELEDP